MKKTYEIQMTLVLSLSINQDIGNGLPGTSIVSVTTQDRITNIPGLGFYWTSIASTQYKHVKIQDPRERTQGKLRFGIKSYIDAVCPFVALLGVRSGAAFECMNTVQACCQKDLG